MGSGGLGNTVEIVPEVTHSALEDSSTRQIDLGNDSSDESMREDMIADELETFSTPYQANTNQSITPILTHGKDSSALFSYPIVSVGG